MPTPNRMAWIVLAIVLFASAAAMAPLARDARPAAHPSLTSLQFLAGTWVQQSDSGYIEEHWAEPVGNALVGLYRRVDQKGTTRLFELQGILAEKEGPVLRVRHFDAAFEPWKNETPSVPALHLTEHEPDRATFRNPVAGGVAAIEYKRRGDELNVAISFQDPSRDPLQFQLKRAGNKPNTNSTRTE